jgi:hypothetical protein
MFLRYRAPTGLFRSVPPVPQSSARIAKHLSSARPAFSFRQALPERGQTVIGCENHNNLIEAHKLIDRIKELSKHSTCAI